MEKFLKSPTGKLVLVVAGLLIIFGIGAWYYSLQRSFAGSQEAITQDQILIKRGNDTVVVNSNGLVEYRLASGTYFDTWSLDKVDAFFASLQAKARAAKGQTPPPAGSNYYTVTLYVDGELVTIYVDGSDAELGQVFNAAPQTGSGFNFDLGDGSSGNSGSGGASTSTPTPIPTNPSTVSAAGGGTGSGGGNTQQDTFNCSLNTQTVAGKTVISNTLCNVQQPD